MLRRRRTDWSDAPEISQAAVNVAAAALAAYDGQTGGHSDDVVTICDSLAGRFSLDQERRTRLLAAAQLHDIGKVAVPPAILAKPAPLDAQEWSTVRKHTVCGEQILSAAPELRQVGRIVRHSHERWDGGGYPDGLAGEDIPLESRIVFCVDAFHAIRSDRPYRAGRPAVEALEEVRRGSGTQFDPAVVQALSDTAEELRASHTGRLGALAASVGSRRLLVLLLALVIGGSAVAAPGSPLRELFGGADGDAQALSCEGRCMPADLGTMGALPGTTASAGPGAGTAAALARARGGGSREPGHARGRDGDRTGKDRRDSGNGSPAGDPGSGSQGGSGQGGSQGGSGSPGGTRSPGGGSGPVRQTPSSGGGSGGGGSGGGGGGGSGGGGGGVGQGPAAQGPGLPGRSGEAPGKPNGPGKFGPGGRSGEAPGKPNGPGKFGQGNGKGKGKNG